MLTGPGIAPGSRFSNLASNVDLAPTMLAIAGLEPPPTMDGRSFLPLVVGEPPAPAGASEVLRGLPGSVAATLARHPPAQVKHPERCITIYTP